MNLILVSVEQLKQYLTVMHENAIHYQSSRCVHVTGRGNEASTWWCEEISRESERVVTVVVVRGCTDSGWVASQKV
jgi:predicted deacetylase